MDKKYIKLLNKQDVAEILKVGGLELLPDRQNFKNELIPSMQRSKNVILCRFKSKNRTLEKLVNYLTLLSVNLQNGSMYDNSETLVFISNFSCNVAALRDEYAQESIDMTLKLKEILAKKDESYIEDFRNYWMNYQIDENDKTENEGK